MGLASRSVSTALVRVEDHILAVTPEQKRAYEALYNLLAPQLFDFAARFLRREDARDAVQQAMCDIWVRWQRLAPRHPGVPFFFRAVKNQITLAQRAERFDRLRLRRFFHHVMRWQRSAPPADAELDRAELAALVDATVAEMPERCREVWTLVRENELTYQQTAASLELSVVTTKRHMTRAQGILRETLVDAGYGEAAAQPRTPVTELLPTKLPGDDVHD